MYKTNAKFRQYGEEWLKTKKQEVKMTTYSRYEAILKNHLLPEFGEKKITEIKKDIVKDFLNRLLKEHKYNTIESIFNVLYGIMHFAGITEFPEIRAFKLLKSRTQIDVLSENEYAKINKALQANTTYRDIGILLALNMGMRIGEVCGVRLEDINFNKGSISIKRTVQRVKSYDGESKTKIEILEPKSRNSIREVAISKSIMKISLAIRKDITDSRAYLLSGKTDRIIEPRNMERYFEKKCIEIIGRKIKFHELRHTFATLSISNGTDVKVVSEILGHSSIVTTLRFYRKVSLKDMSDCVNRIEKILSERIVS